jgi:lipopolysaccharide/colanic/teichoic acid biosynthesis glycosyltransferase
MTKRAFDLVVAGVLLVVCSPVLLLIALVVRLDSPGQVLFRQERVGRGGSQFRIHKFRTMVVGGPGLPVTAVGDPRVTRIGHTLRSTKLDELPQLIDVLAGDMSLVGPRPEVPHYVALWSPQEQDVVLSVRPGITDPASLAFRRESEELGATDSPGDHYVDVILPRKLQMYIEYVETRTLLGDARILVRTVAAVIGR